MKHIPRKFCISIAVIAFLFSFGLAAHAEPPRDELAHAYHLLKKADHDYDGHRVKAMEEVRVAASDLGIELGGDVDDHERQWHSDEQMKEARRLLRDAKDKLEAHDRDRVADHVEMAIKEINAALDVR
jgi:protein-tyrosine-phosphatase